MLEAPHCRGEGVFIQCIIRGFSSPFQRNVAPEMCRGLEGGSVGRVYVQAAPLAWSQRGWIHAANATPVGHCVGRGWERVWGGSRTGPPRIRPLSALTPRPCTAPSLSIPLSLICQRNGEERVISAPAPSRPRAAPPGRWQHGIAFCVTRPGPPPHLLVPWMNPKFVVGARASLPRGSGAAEDSGGGGRGVGAASLGSKTKPGSCSVQCL